MKDQEYKITQCLICDKSGLYVDKVNSFIPLSQAYPALLIGYQQKNDRTFSLGEQRVFICKQHFDKLFSKKDKS